MICKRGAVSCLVMKQMNRTVQFRQIKFTMMDDEAVGINNEESVICVVTCMIMIYVRTFQGLVGDAPVVVDVFKIEWRAVLIEYNGSAQWCLGG